ncbi:hypothetical protein SUGI_1500410 [Cryptomeria japonica]|uniref:Uncharacterized protein n=1 Tax=Cryptomeria japonica TaxID=3369 RepID=A0AAD3RRJ2_CRYJA|nr:hypothetical protein SUGI_1500410 [Cryptomeria japonica]
MEAMFSCGRVAFAIITILCCFTSPAIACPLPERKLPGTDSIAARGEESVVISVDLSGYNLKGNISSSLFQLSGLEHLDLSHNLFKGKFSPPHNRKLKSLTFLDLSFAGYVNESSPGLVREFYVSLESLSNLVSLEYLSLARVNISVNKEGGEVVGSLSNLQQLSMSDCGLGGPIPNSLLKLTSLGITILEETFLSLDNESLLCH